MPSGSRLLRTRSTTVRTLAASQRVGTTKASFGRARTEETETEPVSGSGSNTGRAPFNIFNILKGLGLKDHSAGKILLILFVLTLLALLIHGYHPGVEDDGVYLPAIKRDINPNLYPHDFEFFTLQLQATVFDKLVAGSVRLSHLPLPVVVLAWHILTIFTISLGCWRISRLCFPE